MYMCAPPHHRYIQQWSLDDKYQRRQSTATSRYSPMSVPESLAMARNLTHEAGEGGRGVLVPLCDNSDTCAEI